MNVRKCMKYDDYMVQELLFARLIYFETEHLLKLAILVTIKYALNKFCPNCVALQKINVYK